MNFFFDSSLLIRKCLLYFVFLRIYIHTHIYMQDALIFFLVVVFRLLNQKKFSLYFLDQILFPFEPINIHEKRHLKFQLVCLQQHEISVHVQYAVIKRLELILVQQHVHLVKLFFVEMLLNSAYVLYSNRKIDF